MHTQSFAPFVFFRGKLSEYARLATKDLKEHKSRDDGYSCNLRVTHRIATQQHTRFAWMHDNAINDLALASWSVWLSSIKRSASLTNRNQPKRGWMRLAKRFSSTTPFSQWRQVRFLKIQADDPPLGCNGLLFARC